MDIYNLKHVKIYKLDLNQETIKNMNKNFYLNLQIQIKN